MKQYLYSTALEHSHPLTPEDLKVHLFLIVVNIFILSAIWAFFKLRKKGGDNK